MGEVLSEGKRALLLTQWFDPEPTAKGLSFARALRARGFDVDVLTGFPNYPDGHLYGGYKLRPYQRDTIDGVTIHRSWLFPSHDRSAVRRTINYVSFSISAMIAGLTKVRRPNLIYAYHPPATVGVAGAFLKRRFAVPLVLDVQDLWPDTVLSSGMMRGGIAMDALGAACRWEYRQADRVVALSRQMAELLERRGVEQSRLSVIRNWADESRISAKPTSEATAAARAELGGKFCILFAGQMGAAQKLDNALAAATLTPAVKWVFLGGGTERERLAATARALGLTNVSFVGRIPIENIRAWLDAADALLVHLSDDPLYRASIPSKTQAYMLAGRPVLMVAEGAAAELVEEAKAGVTCRPGDPRALADAAARMANMSFGEREELGRNGRGYYDRELSLDVGVGRFARLFNEVVAGNAK